MGGVKSSHGLIYRSKKLFLAFVQSYENFQSTELICEMCFSQSHSAVYFCLPFFSPLLLTEDCPVPKEWHPRLKLSLIFPFRCRKFWLAWHKYHDIDISGCPVSLRVVASFCCKSFSQCLSWAVSLKKGFLLILTSSVIPLNICSIHLLK